VLPFHRKTTTSYAHEAFAYILVFLFLLGPMVLGASLCSTGAEAASLQQHITAQGRHGKVARDFTVRSQPHLMLCLNAGAHCGQGGDCCSGYCYGTNNHGASNRGGESVAVQHG
jgi:hypothetical protein